MNDNMSSLFDLGSEDTFNPFADSTDMEIGTDSIRSATSWYAGAGAMIWK